MLLSKAGVHVYLVDIRKNTDEKTQQNLLRFLSSEKQETSLLRRLESAVGDALLSYAIWKEWGILPQEQVIRKTADGKPYLANRQDIYFSKSHSHSMVVCAVSDRPVGADIQKICPYSRRVLQRVASEDVIRYVESSENRDTAFTSVWAQFEARAKINGGMFRPPVEKPFYSMVTQIDSYVLSVVRL